VFVVLASGLVGVGRLSVGDVKEFGWALYGWYGVVVWVVVIRGVACVVGWQFGVWWVLAGLVIGCFGWRCCGVVGTGTVVWWALVVYVGDGRAKTGGGGVPDTRFCMGVQA